MILEPEARIEHVNFLVEVIGPDAGSMNESTRRLRRALMHENAERRFAKAIEELYAQLAIAFSSHWE